MREIWILVRSAGALVNQATLLELRERQATCSNVVTFIKHFIRFAIKEQSPIPWHALVDGALCANVSRAVACEGVVPPWLSMQTVERTQVLLEPRPRLIV